MRPTAVMGVQLPRQAEECRRRWFIAPTLAINETSKKDLEKPASSSKNRLQASLEGIRGNPAPQRKRKRKNPDSGAASFPNPG